MTDAPAKPQGPSVRLVAMNLLARREHSFHELLDKLSGHFPELDPVRDLRPALERLRDEGLQSDQRFAGAWVRYRSSRGIGPLKIRAELQPRRLAPEILEEALHQDGIDWEALCEEVFLRKFRPARRADLREKARWQRFLQQRGFAHAEIREVLRRAGAAAAGQLDEYDSNSSDEEE
jgi:regulatory protein